jgi:hypothetical protein
MRQKVSVGPSLVKKPRSERKVRRTSTERPKSKAPGASGDLGSTPMMHAFESIDQDARRTAVLIARGDGEGALALAIRVQRAIGSLHAVSERLRYGIGPASEIEAERRRFLGLANFDQRRDPAVERSIAAEATTLREEAREHARLEAEEGGAGSTTMGDGIGIEKLATTVGRLGACEVALQQLAANPPFAGNFAVPLGNLAAEIGAGRATVEADLQERAGLARPIEQVEAERRRLAARAATVRNRVFRRLTQGS